MKTYIVIAQVDDVERPYLEDKEGETFKTLEEAYNSLDPNCHLMELSDFMDHCNDEDVCLSNSWIGYVYVSGEGK